jgi:hypothetical protein
MQILRRLTLCGLTALCHEDIATAASARHNRASDIGRTRLL